MKTALIKKTDLSYVEDIPLNEKQLKLLLSKTPKEYTHKRPAKGGGTWTYVTGGYVRKVLNLMFGWDWDFEIVNGEVIGNEAVVLGKLTCRVNGKTITKMQYGNKEVMYKKSTKIPLSIGNDMKAASTDALKKCAAEIGIAADIYNAQDFKEVEVSTEIETPEDKERNRVINFIEIALSVDQLNKIPESYKADEEIAQLIVKKALELS